MPERRPDSELDELIRAADPVVTHVLAEPSQSPDAAALFERVTGYAYVDVRPIEAPRPARAPRWGQRLRHHLRLWLAAMVAALGLGGGVTYALTSGQPTQQAGVACFATDNVNGDHTATLVSDAGALVSCEEAWRAGQIPGQPASAPPPLQACALPYGTTGVFPDRQGTQRVCQRLHLQPVEPAPTPPPSSRPSGTTPGHAGTSVPLTSKPTVPPGTTGGPSTTVAPFVAANNKIVAELLASCVDDAAAERLVRQALDQAGLSNWTVAVAAPFTAARPCASPSYDQSTDTFYIVPIPPNQPSPGSP